MRAGSITQSFASLAARGLMRKGASSGAGEGGRGSVSPTDGRLSGAGDKGLFIKRLVETGALLLSSIKAGETPAVPGAVTAGTASPGSPRKPTVHCTGTFRPGGTIIFNSVSSS